MNLKWKTISFMPLFCQSCLSYKKVQCVLLKLFFLLPENVCLIEKEILQIVADLKAFNSVTHKMKILLKLIKKVELILLQYMILNLKHHGMHPLTPSKMGGVKHFGKKSVGEG